VHAKADFVANVGRQAGDFADQGALGFVFLILRFFDRAVLDTFSLVITGILAGVWLKL
jgi:hypothetical protein